ncbi:MAG: hypothetical protein HYV41_00910 [Candidatus Magasanikbacteria bacterium]|nr:hypothetical protein [Candidatus Magasanikbacteria bacterium]
MAEKNLYIGYDEQADELIITTNPKAKTVGYFIDSGTAVLLGMKDMKPYGFSIVLLKEYFKKHTRKAFTKIPLSANVTLPHAVTKFLAEKNS